MFPALALIIVVCIAATRLVTGRGAESDDRASSQLLRDRPSLDAARRRLSALEQGIVIIGGVQVRVGDGSAIDWTDSHGRGRSFLRLLHGLMPIRDLAIVAADGDREAAAVALAIVGSWRAHNPRNAPADKMAWHDETSAQRLISLVELWEALQALDSPPNEVDDLAQLSLQHVRLLLDSQFHSTGTNHGMFQDQAILAWATSAAAADRAEADAAQATATRRVVEYLTGSVSSDGVHLEHAPAYHQLIASNAQRYAAFFEAVGDGASAEELKALRATMTTYATHVIQPDGTFPLVSDTFSTDRPNLALFDDPGYRFAASAGASGEAPEATTAFFPEAGYAIMRSAWERGGRGTYLHLTAAYHGNYHKHADDLSLWVYHDGPLLTEAGPNGYGYDDPFTIYGFGPSSHNVVLVDGEGVPRTDGRTDAVRLVASDSDGVVSMATARTERLPDAVHVRNVRFDRVSDRITVTDALTSNRPRTYDLLWHTAPGVTGVQRGGAIELSRAGRPAAILRVDAPEAVSVDAVIGATDFSGGWRLGGGDPTPMATYRFEVEGRESVEFTTTIELQ